MTCLGLKVHCLDQIRSSEILKSSGVGCGEGGSTTSDTLAVGSCSALVTVSSKLVTGPLTLMICVLVGKDSSWGLSLMESLDIRRLPLSTVITVVEAWPGDVGLVEVEDLVDEVTEDLEAL